MSFHILPLACVYCSLAGIFAMLVLSFQEGIASDPAETKEDYIPLVFVVAASLFMHYAFLYYQSATTFIEFAALEKEYKEQNIQGEPSLNKLKYGKENRNILAADRGVGNYMEQLIPFGVFLFLYATYVSVFGAQIHGWLWIFFRSYYVIAWKAPFPWLFASTLPAYACIFSMVGITLYTIA